MRPLLLASALLLTLLAGCADGPAPPDASGDVADPTDEGAAESAGGSEEPAAEDEETGRVAAGTTRTKTVQDEGTLPAGAGVPDEAVPNAGMVTGMDRWFRKDIDGTVLAAELTMTWQAAAPGTETLRLTFSPIEERDGGEWMTGAAKHVEGTSPLVLSLDDLDWDEEMYTVAVWWAGDVAGGPEQPFTVEGEITYE